MHNLFRFLALALLLGSLPRLHAQPNPHASMSHPKVLFVVTSHGQKGSTGQPTGYYLSEVAHPWAVLRRAGYDIDFVSPQGGQAPVDGFDLTDATNRAFWEDPTYRAKIEHTLRPAQVNPGEYAAIYYAGGHGAMWDLADNQELAALAARIYESGGVVGAVCHGPAGLVNVRLSTGQYLVAGKKLNGFSNEEEAAVGLSQVVPFLLETKLLERGARFEKVGLWQPHVVVDQRLVTGQNPASATGVGEALVAELAKLPASSAAHSPR
jgi:putative intracellular protease/amidase